MNLEERVRQLENAFRQIFNDIKSIFNRVEKLEECCCSSKMFYITIDGIFWYSTEGEIDLNLEDRLPTDGVCNGAKAIALTEDATLYLLYMGDPDGWIVQMSSYGGKSICCGCGQN